jgi:hypothetical protein
VRPTLTWIRSDRLAVAPLRSRQPSAEMATAGKVRPRSITSVRLFEAQHHRRCETVAATGRRAELIAYVDAHTRP